MVKRNLNNGQATLIILLVMAVSLTLGLATSKKTVVETKIDEDEELSKQAFNAAESGIDVYLGTGKVGTNAYSSSDTTTNSRADVSVSDIGSSSGNIIDFNEVTPQNKSQLFWLVAHDEDGNIATPVSAYPGDSVNVCIENSFSRSVKIDFYYRDNSGNYQVERQIVNLTNTPPIVNNATLVTLANDSCGLGKKNVVQLNTNHTSRVPLLVAVTPLFGSARIYLQADNLTNEFPSQGETIVSKGSAGNVNSSVASTVVRTQRRWGSEILDFMLDGITARGGIGGN